MVDDGSHPVVVFFSKEKAIKDLFKLINLAEYNFMKVKKVLIKSNVCGMFPPDIRL